THFSVERMRLSGDDVAEKYQRLDIRAVIFDVDTETRSGVAISNDEVAASVRRHPDVLIGCGSVDPWKGDDAVREVERCVLELGLRGMKFEQTAQQFMPDDARFFPIWEACSRLRVPVVFHTGMAGIGVNTPGGSGIRLKYANPMPLDEVAA